MSLTPNAISQMFRMGGSTDNPSFSPTVQVIHVKKIDNKGGGDERFKVSYICYYMKYIFCIMLVHQNLFHTLWVHLRIVAMQNE